MQIICHRLNSIKSLNKTDPKFGVEVDIRTNGNDLVIHHDPFVDGDSFEKWIKNYRHKTLILNVKEEGLEERLIKIMECHAIEDYFFLDQSIPFLIKTSTSNPRCAVRVSEFERIQAALKFSERVDWVWVAELESSKA